MRRRGGCHQQQLPTARQQVPTKPTASTSPTTTTPSRTMNRRLKTSKTRARRKAQPLVAHPRHSSRHHSSLSSATVTSRVLSTSVILVILFAVCQLWPHAASVGPAQAAPQSLDGGAKQTLVAPVANSTLQQQLMGRQQTQASFATPNQAINITRVTYDPLYDTVYLGATNTIYQLNGTDLSVQFEQSNGPVLDNPNCGVTECHGFEDFMKPTQNVNKILVIDYMHKKLLTCGSTKQGACRRYQLNNIAQKEDLISMAVAANDDNSSTYAFIAPARYVYDPSSSSATSSSASNSNLQQQQQVLYVASTYTKVGQSRELLVPAIGTRTLDDGPNLLKLYENSFLDSARIDINSHLRDYFLVNYLYGFASSNYIYFVTVQKKATSRDFEELGYHTRLARICITDSSYNSYTEVDLKCVPNKRKPSSHSSQPAGRHSSVYNNQQQQQQTSANQPNDYPILQDAILVDAGSQLLQSLAQNDHSGAASGNYFFDHSLGSSSSPDDNKVLLGVFSSAKDHTQYAGEHSALCAFSLAQIEEKFNDNIHNCYTGKMQSRNMEYIAGNVQECPKSGQGGNVVNFCHETLKINGTIPIVSEAAIQFSNTTLTAITATSHIDSQTKNIYSEQLANELSANASASSPSSTSSSKSIFSSMFNNLLGNSHNDNNNGQAMNSRPHTVAFVGTSNGHIKKILLNNVSNGIEFEDIQVDTNPILGDLHLHSSGNQLIAATPYKVMKVATHNCGQYATCRECSQSRNPYCGWCSLRKSCTTRSECVPLNQQQQQQQPARPALGPGEGNSLNGNKQQLKWISSINSTGKCIELQSIVPDKIPMTSTGKIDLYIDRLPRLPAGNAYRCIFNASEQTTATATPFGLSCPLPKLMDRQQHIQIEPGRDHAVVELAVRSSETNTDFLDGKLTFFECQRHTTCKDCLSTNWGCNWCLNENVCLFNTSRCEKTGQQVAGRHQLDSAGPLVQLVAGSGGRQSAGTGPILVSTGANPQRSSTVITTGAAAQPRVGNTISQVQQCPTFDVGHQQDILIADGSEKELSIRVKNMPQFKGAIKCIVEIENYEISLKARIHEDRVTCENSTYSYAADVGLLNGQLKVIYSDSNIYIDRTNFTLYKCHLLGAYLNRPDCSLCQRIDARFKCAWCSNSCQHQTRCQAPPDSACPSPRIDFIHPLSGPALGGTRVTIEGSNLGQSFDEIANRVLIGNAPCKPLEEEYRPSNRIVCVTSPVVAARFAHANGSGTGNANLISRQAKQQAEQQATGFSLGESSLAAAVAAAANSVDLIAGDIMVGNRAGYSLGPAKFHFKSIHLRDHQPRYGPQSGGTRLVLSGLNLNIGSSVQVFLDELPCLLEPGQLTSEQIVCKTAASRQHSRAIKHLKLIIDDAQIVRDGDDVFYYTADPIISKVTPLKAYLSGGRPINVFGANLTSVQAPRLAIHDPNTGKRVNETNCILQDDTRMQCPSPAVNLQLMDLDYSEQHLNSQYDPQHSFAGGSTLSSSDAPSSWSSSSSAGGSTAGRFQASQLIQQDDSVRFRLSFIMDNVHQTIYPNLNLEIAYTSDPRLFAFASAQYKSAQDFDQANQAAMQLGALDSSAPASDQQTYQLDSDTYLLQPNEPVLVLYGEHLRASLSEYEITVTVGQDLCNLTQLSQTKLVCLLSLDHIAAPTDEEGHQTQRLLPLVVVRIGFNLRYELGFVQYHPVLLQQIANSSGGSGLHSSSSPSSSSSSSFSSSSLAHINPTYTQYLPRQSESLLSKLSNYLATLLMLLIYLTVAVIVLLMFVYSGLLDARATRRLATGKLLAGGLGKLVCCFSKAAYMDQEYRRIQAKVDSLEKSIRDDCRLAALALHSDLNELVRSVELTGAPLVSMKQYAIKVFFPGMNNHPLLLKTPGERQQPHPSLGHFQRLVLTKPFLLTFIGTLERQPNFTIRDRVNVASLIMIILMERLDYATDILKTLLLQLVERSVAAAAASVASGPDDQRPPTGAANYRKHLGANKTLGSKLTRRASNLLNGLPISKRPGVCKTGGRVAADLGKYVGGSANSLMASTSVAAQMLLARVNSHAKASPWQQTVADVDTSNYSQYVQALEANLADPQQQQVYGVEGGDNFIEFMNTTAFNQRNLGQLNGGHTQRPARQAKLLRPKSHQHQQMVFSNTLAGCQPSRYSASLLSSSTASSSSRSADQRQIHLMLRRSDTIVEKMLTNWLALNMYDHFHGEAGQSLYMLFEALKCQLERGPIDSVSGDAFYSLGEQKLLHEPAIQFEMVNLYVIVDSDVLQPHHYHHQQQHHQHQQQQHQQTANLLVDSSVYGKQPDSGSSLTLTLRALDCDTISQVKAKILANLYRNAPYSRRLGADDVELSLRQQPNGIFSTLSAGQQLISVPLYDEDLSSETSMNKSKKINTLRHYGITEQAIMMLTRVHNQSRANATARPRTDLTNVLDEHYNNPYAEIQYGPLSSQLQVLSGQAASAATPVWHLSSRTAEQVEHSNGSSPTSNSPSVLLLGANSVSGNPVNAARTHYHPSSSSTSSTGQVIDTHSTSANSSSLANNRQLLHQQLQVAPLEQRAEQQPIYCQIGSMTGQSQQQVTSSSSGTTNNNNNNNNNSYYCQISSNQLPNRIYSETSSSATAHNVDQIYLSRMLASKATVQEYIDEFFKTMLDGGSQRRRQQQQGAPQQQHRQASTAIKWLFDLLDEAAKKNGVSDQKLIDSWKSNAFLLRFWANFIKNPDYVLDVEKSDTLDASLSTIAQTLMDSCTPTTGDAGAAARGLQTSKLIFSKDIPKYRELVKRFYQDVSSLRSVSDREMIEQASSISLRQAGMFDSELALKELCVYAVNYGVELMNALNSDFTCRQMELSGQLEQCFRSFTLFEAYQ